ncbi:Nardilysin [Atta colombica]|uniref:Nardilysin n=1 Tax=Atta colombica TaxID=520822 RepID=A0A195AVN4_9HYME|nr:PREDICTED: nardilysin-like [Atta colombica]KYM76122.1 Nardilysin [Atta colombica]
MTEIKHTTKGNKFLVEYLNSPDISGEYHKADYRVVKLQNGLTALLISGLEKANYDDTSYKDYEEGSSTVKRLNTDVWKAFCSLCVGVGSFSDPPEVPGLAYFLQRMVFMGSEKYPKENGFNEFISLHGGTIDGATDCEHTRFYFDVSEKHLFVALDRFVQFFIGPLMKKDAIKRERKVIQREFRWSSSSDKNTKQQLLSFIARTGHPPNKMFWSNLITLHSNIDDDKLYEELHKFRKRHYSAHRMMLAIQARLSLDTLEVYVANFFSNIPSNWLPSDDFTEFKDGVSFNTDTFKKMYHIKPFSQEISQLHITWALPSILDLYRSKPYKYVSWIIEHKGNNSLASYLRKKMWGFDVFCGYCDNDNGFGYNSMYVLFEITVELTHEGIKHQQDVLDAIFSFINLVKKTGPQENTYNEIYKIGKNNFRFFSKHDDVFDLCKSMHFYPSRDYVTGKHIYFEYNPEAIQKCLDFLMPETANIMIFNSDFEINIDDPRLKINYTYMALSKASLEHWKSIEPLPDFQLPLRNEFLTNNFSTISISAEASEYPVKIHEDCMSQIWFRPKFYWPMCHINLHLFSALNPRLAKNAALLQMYCNVLKYLLLEELHPAVMAGFGYKIDVNEEATGITIQISGFDENLPSWLMVIANYMVDLVPFSKDLLRIMRMQQLKAHYNKFVEPETFIEDLELWLLKSGNCTHVHKYNALRRYLLEDFQDFIKSFTNNLYIQCLVQGNVTKDFTMSIIQQFIKKINCFSLNKEVLPTEVNEIPQGTSFLKLKNINPTNVNSVVTNYYQVGSASIELSVLIELMLMIMKEPLMNHLRNQRKLSYASCDLRDIKRILGYSITVYTQADKCTTEYVDQWIEEFLNSFRIMLEQFSEKELDDVKEGLRILKQHDDTDTLKNRVDRDWNEIMKRQYMFDRCEKEALAIENININKLREFFEMYTLDGSSFRKLSVHVVGTPKAVAVNAKNLRHSVYSLKELIIDDSRHNSATDHHITDVNYYRNTLRCYYRL